MADEDYQDNGLLLARILRLEHAFWGGGNPPKGIPPVSLFYENLRRKLAKEGVNLKTAREIMDEMKHEGLPVKGYQPQDDAAVEMVNFNKEMEERVLRHLDDLLQFPDKVDQRWLAIARTNIELGFMALNRSVFKPARVELSEDGNG